MEQLPAGSVARLRDRWALELDSNQVARLEGYAEWLREEAVAAGGLGPAEIARVWDRHLLDALSFATVWEGVPPDRLLDVGTGVGLPGIPLAIAYPAIEVSLIDRSGRRCRLLRRAVRVSGLTNVAVFEADIEDVGIRDLGMPFPAVVMRAALAADRLDRLTRWVAPGGMVAVGWARDNPKPAPQSLRLPEGWTVRIHEVRPGVLEMPAWILIMARP